MRKLGAWVPGLCLGLALAACSGASPPGAVPPGGPAAIAAPCANPSADLRPSTADWPEPDRQALQAQLRRGAVAVRFDGCVAQPLASCRVAAASTYVGAPRQDDRFALASGRVVSVSMVGTFVVDRPLVRTTDLSGECGGATHVIAAATVGAFESGGGCAAAASTDAAPPPGCDAVVALELAPIAPAFAGAAENALARARERAAAHQRSARQLEERARALPDPRARRAGWDRAVEEHRLAARAFTDAVAESSDPEDEYELRYGLSEALTRGVIATVQSERAPRPSDVEQARRAAIALRDARPQGHHTIAAAQMLVELADQVRRAQEDLHGRTSGALGLEHASYSSKAPPTPRPIPALVTAAMSARDEYRARVPSAEDTTENGKLFAFQAAEDALAYGQLADARGRFDGVYQSQCGKTAEGYKAWERLLAIAQLEKKPDAVAALIAASQTSSCAINDSQRSAEAVARSRSGP